MEYEMVNAEEMAESIVIFFFVSSMVVRCEPRASKNK